MKIAVEGCCHGELDKIYETVAQLEKRNGFKIDVLIICGDFQSVRNMEDLQSMAVPPKYQKLNTFYRYYSGEKVAPVLTIFVGGNHEASNYLQELPYGGWVARNIYYLGYAGIIQVGGVRIGGVSGIYKGNDYNKGHFEHPPYDEGTKRSVYHVRNLEVFRLKQVTRPVDIFVSHDWPTGIYDYGDAATLLRTKPFFKKEVETGTLGSKPCAALLTHLKPSYWFAAHLHVKFAAYVQHMGDGDEDRVTRFLALDKCLPRRKFLQVLDVPHKQEEGLKIKLDPEWLRILQTTNHLLNLTPANRFMPGPGGNDRWDFTVSDSDMESVRELFGGDLTLPENFVETAPAISGNPGPPNRHRASPLFVRVNPQTTLLCTMLEITDPSAKLLGKTSEQLLEESNIGLVSEKGDDGGDGGDDDVDSDEIEMRECPVAKNADATFNPSFVDSSMDLFRSPATFSASNISASWDKLIPVDRKKDCIDSSPSTNTMINVADDDDELQAILSLQRSKSLPATPHHPNPVSTQSGSTSPSTRSTTPPSEESVSSSLSLLSSSTPLHKSSTVPPLTPSSSSSSSLLSSSSPIPHPDNTKVECASILSSSLSQHSDSSKSNNNNNLSSSPKKLSVADRLKALNRKSSSTSDIGGEADSTSSSDINTPSLASTLSRLASDPSSQSQSQTLSSPPKPNLAKSDTLDARGTRTRAELESLCAGASSGGVSSTTISSSPSSAAAGGVGERLSPPLKRSSSDLDTLVTVTESGCEGSQVTSSSSLLSSSSSNSSSFSSSTPGAAATAGAGVKKLKRRNVSLYQESQE